MKKVLAIAAFALAFTALNGGLALACPGCSAALGSAAGTSQEVIWGKAFCLSIYFMLFAVHVLIGFAGYKVYGLIKSEDKKYADKYSE